MIEYFYDAIKASAGKEICIAARVSTENGTTLTDQCHLTLSREDGSTVVSVVGSLLDDAWQFVIPADATEGLRGRFWYCICTNDADLCFKQPFYLV